MRLKKLSLHGYKTFASKTEFEFDEGITAIVGPNGSGKSNIADALRWVLGEQSYSTLRGKKTIDMIFAGSQKRPRSGMAQAILTLDNSDGWLPIDYTEIEIGRRAFRSGENEYLLNGQKVRLRDITELLASSGLAERTYTIIGQGLIDQALSLRAEERRALFEEAAGISHYKSRRAETLRRLQETQHNLERIHDILSEIKPRLRSLKRQAKRAQNYDQVAADLKHLLRLWYGYRWEQTKKEVRLARLKAEEAQKAWEEGRQQQRQQQQALEQKRKRFNRLQQQVAEHEKKREQLREELEQARRQVAILSERQKLVADQLAEIATELPNLQQQQQQARQALDQALADLEVAQANLSQQQEKLKAFQADYRKQQALINQHRQRLSSLDKQRRQTLNRLAQAEGQLSQLQERLQDKTAEQIDLSEAEQLEAAIAEAATAVTTLEKEQTTFAEQQTQLREEKRGKIEHLKKLRQEAAQADKQLNKLEKESARLQTRCDMLDKMRRQHMVWPEDLPLIGQLASLITIPAEYRQALEAALADRLGTLILPDEQALWQLLEQPGEGAISAAVASQARVGRSTKAPEHQAVIGWADEQVSHPDELAEVVQLILGHILLVRDIEAAYVIAQKLPAGATAVTLNGIIVQAGGLVELRPSDEQSTILAREEAWQEAQAALEEGKGKQRATRKKMRQKEAEIEEWQTAVDQLATQEQEHQRQAQESQRQIHAAQRKLDRLQQQQSFIIRRKDEHEAEIKRLQERISKVESAISEYRQQATQVEQELNEAQQALDALPVAEAQEQRRSLNQQIDSAQTIASGRQAVVDSRRATLNQVDRQLRRQENRHQELVNQQEEMDLNIHKAALSQLQQEMDALKAALEPLQQDLESSRQALHQAEETLDEQQQHSHDLETRYTQSKIELNQQENKIENLHERIQNDLGLVNLAYDDEQTGPTPLPMSELVEQLPTVDELPDDIEESIQKYRGQLHRMGPINPDAPAEYEETQERHDFLTQQIEDLNQTQQQLRDVIEELDDLTSRAFAETVTKVDKVFGNTFKRLFGGGSAQLVLTDPDDLTISGVDIVARLPSRREQGLALLSGGERSLTAAALIFSLLQVSPTPFCVLDEVDAMLDEANVNRFRDMLLELQEQTQFIIITHNRGTVQIAQTIYGISMGTDSVSQALSIKPEDYVRQEERAKVQATPI